MKRIQRKVRKWKFKIRKKKRNIDTGGERQGDQFRNIHKANFFTNFESHDGDDLLASKSNRKKNKLQKLHEPLPSTPKNPIKNLITFSDEKKSVKRHKESRSKKEEAKPQADEYKPAQVVLRKNHLAMKHKRNKEEPDVSYEGQHPLDEDPLPSAYKSQNKLTSEHKGGDEKKNSKLAKKISKPNEESAVRKNKIIYSPISIEVRDKVTNARQKGNHKKMDIITTLNEKTNKSVLNTIKSQPFQVPLAENLQHKSTKLRSNTGQKINSRKISLDTVKKAARGHASAELNRPSIPKPVSNKEKSKQFQPEDTAFKMFELFTSDTKVDPRGNDDENKIRVFPLKPRESVKYTLIRRHSSAYSQEVGKSSDVNLKHSRRYSYQGPLQDSRDFFLKSSRAQKPRLKDRHTTKRLTSEPKAHCSNDLNQPTSTKPLQSTHFSSHSHQRSHQEAPELGSRHASRRHSSSYNKPEFEARKGEYSHNLFSVPSRPRKKDLQK